MNEVAFNFEDFIMPKHLAQYFFENEYFGLGRDFWNKVCMLDRGYDTVKDEYCTNFYKIKFVVSSMVKNIDEKTLHSTCA